MARSLADRLAASRRQQLGVTTLAITLMLLVILTLMVLFAASTGFFEQRTTNNENRGRLVEQAAEYGVNLAGEYLKANRDRLIEDDATKNGWLAAGGTRRWVRCSAIGTVASDFAAGHPCLAERDDARRAQLYFYSSNGAVGGSTNMWTAVTAGGLIPSAAILDTISVGVGGTANFATTTSVGALLCRIDSSLLVPGCRAVPVAGNRIAVTLVADARLPDENAWATVKETWGSFSDSSPMSAVPLVASGTIQGVGNAQIVTSPNAGGFGVAVSMWSPNDIDIQGPGSVGSVSTCQLGEYLKSTPEAELKTTCATSNTACGCPAITATGSDFLSGHSTGVKREREDILDRDGNLGATADGTPTPDIQFYPGAGLDDPADATDDSLFEWIFGVDYEASEASTNGATLQNCSGPANCAIYALTEDLGAESVTCAALNALGPAATGLYYVTDSSSGTPCGLPDQLGTPDAPAVVVVNDEARLNQTLLYGMLFVRSDNNTAYLRGNGNSKVFGSVVVEGNVDIVGGLDLVYDDTAVSVKPNKLPKSAKFGRIPGTWLDSRTGF